MVAAGAEAYAALVADDFMIFTQAVATTRADGNRGTMAIHNALGHQASGDYLLTPAFSFNKGSHDVLLSAVIRVVLPRRAAPDDRAPDKNVRKGATGIVRCRCPENGCSRGKN